ncbi:4-oxalocrotonate tautomerase [Salmonella enterica subsp. enterica]|uniref:tautomerase family protein n=1 Tax=Serratia marcescens TaxID=615 RepID=UPI000B6064FE|nr:tautomerase family protein [Serratia marcescens]EBQ2012846.1 4-oxalocrotonate tautomerase [Salmonella enterica subsp. enterica]ASL95996.1 hypothetical protein BVG94_25355 [Serratia marcescens]ECJ6738230.1 4-oxalocrotonate tautomerase [Salmonella enterica subsp. enterica]HEJ6931401.1 tautomerase family protein [Serratia marcescens]HEJ7076178.1 tautomerase family protein [Serratia marcescens]
MPYVNLTFSREDPISGAGQAPEQKSELIEKISSVIAEITGRPVGLSCIFIKEIDNHNWGFAGKPLKND